MAEPLLGLPALVARVERDLGALLVTGRVAGPAGSSAVGLGPLEVDLDTADPGSLVELLVPLTGQGAVPPEAAILLAALVGDERARLLADAAPRGGSRTIRLAAQGPWGPPGSLPRSREGAVVPLQRLALASAHVHRFGATAFQQGVAWLTIAVETAHLHLPALAGAAAQHAALGAALVLDGRPPDPWALSHDAASALAGLLRSAARSGLVPDRTAQHLGTLADPYERGSGTRDLASAMAAPAPRAFSRAAPALHARARTAAAPTPRSLRGRLEVAAESLPGPLAGGPSPSASWLDDGNIEVVVAAWSGDLAGLWARAFRPGTDLLVAAAPLLAAASGHRSVLLVPPHLALDVDVVTDLRAPRPSRALASSMVAFAHGRAAAQSERLGTAHHAAGQWRASSAAHADAGDHTRSTLAEDRAMPDRRSPASRTALASDHLDSALR